LKRRADTGKWEVRWRENGTNRSRSFSFRADAARFEAAVRRAREVGRPLDLDRGRESLGAFVERWWRDYALMELEAATREHYGRIWEKHLRERIAHLPLRDVTPAVVDGLRAELVRGGAGAPTVRKALAILSGVFRCAVLWDRVDRNPVREVRLPSSKRSRLIRPLHPRRVEAMRALLLADGLHRDATLLALLAYAGVRPEEARALRWSDVRDRTILVERAAAGSTVKATKTRGARTVRLLPPLAEDLGRWKLAASPSKSDLVFPSANGTVWTDYDWRNWRARVYKPVARRAGLGETTPYDLRHSFASLLIREGLSVVEVARQLGHSPTLTLNTYSHVFEEFDPGEPVSSVGAIIAARAEFNVRGVYAGSDATAGGEPSDAASTLEADGETRTPDPFITSEVLYQLSYVGGTRQV
jgi:integrase